MQDRNVVTRGSGGSIATISFIALLVIAVVIGLFIWQPWNNTGAQFMTITTHQDHSDQH